MKRIIYLLALGLATVTVPAMAQTDKPNVSAPSSSNSGAGIPGQPGNKNGPAPNKGTVGSATNPENPTVSNQDAANIKGLPGNKNGPPAKKPSDQR